MRGGQRRERDVEQQDRAQQADLISDPSGIWVYTSGDKNNFAQ